MENENLPLIESDELIETNTNDIVAAYNQKGKKRVSYNYPVEIVDYDVNPLSIKFKVHGHTVYFTFENLHIKTQADLKKLLSDSNVLNNSDINILCDCLDNKYRFSYWQTAKGYGIAKEHRRPESTNPENNLGPGCKHIACILKQKNNWIKQIKLSDDDISEELNEKL